MNNRYTFLTALLLLVFGMAIAGNPDRQGEAGAYELLINPWARSAGLHSLNTASISGVEAMGLNVAGLARAKNLQMGLGHTMYVADSRLNAFGLGKKVGNGAFGVFLQTMDFGDLEVTTTNNPEGTGATFSPSFVNVGLMYSHQFENKVSVGVGVKFISESITNAAANGFAIDAGVQYVTGEDDRFKFGISLRNIGSRMQFRGEGLATQLEAPAQSATYNLTYYTRPADFELPSQLNIGAAYDWPVGEVSKVTLLGNFVSNAFSQDQVGAGLEFLVNGYFTVRGAYKQEFGATSIPDSFDNGFSGGFTVKVPVKKTDMGFYLDYAYRSTQIYNGIHNLSLTIDM